MRLLLSISCRRLGCLYIELVFSRPPQKVLLPRSLLHHRTGVVVPSPEIDQNSPLLRRMMVAAITRRLEKPRPPPPQMSTANGAGYKKENHDDGNNEC